MPGERITVSSVENKLVLSGEVSSAARAEKARALAAAFVGKDKADQVVNQLSVVTPNQVNLRVRIAEVDRSVLKQLGINWQEVRQPLRLRDRQSDDSASVTDIIGSGVTNTASAAWIGIGTREPPTSLATLDALAQEGLITTLAEPNMTAMNGQTASFLVGGEFPVPTSVSAGGGGRRSDDRHQIQGFRREARFHADHPRCQSSQPEASARGQQAHDQRRNFPAHHGHEFVTIPALTVTRAETTVELASGQSFALAGLLRHDTTQDISKVPGLGDIPILGQLFRSDQFQRDETELVIIVTPYLVNPVATASLATPTDGYVPPHDVARITDRRHLPAAAAGAAARSAASRQQRSDRPCRLPPGLREEPEHEEVSLPPRHPGDAGAGRMRARSCRVYRGRSPETAEGRQRREPRSTSPSPPDPTQLAPGEAARLQRLAMSGRISPQDRVTVAAAGGPLLRQQRIDMVSRELVQYGIVATASPLVGVPRDRAIIEVGRYLVTLPACPNWSQDPASDFTNAKSSNFGCATAINLGLMVASPADLVSERELAQADGTPAVSAVTRYLTDKVKLPETTAGAAALAAGSGHGGAPAAGAGTPTGTP